MSTDLPAPASSRKAPPAIPPSGSSARAIPAADRAAPLPAFPVNRLYLQERTASAAAIPLPARRAIRARRRVAALDSTTPLRHSPALIAARRPRVPQDQSHDPIAAETLRGFNVLVGYRLAEWRDDFARVELGLEPKHLNRSGIVHGGVIATLLDVTLGYCGIFTAEPGSIRRSVTLSMTTSYLGQAKSGTLSCIARRRGGGKTIFMASGEVLDEAGTLIAMGEGTFRYIASTPR